MVDPVRSSRILPPGEPGGHWVRGLAESSSGSKTQHRRSSALRRRELGNHKGLKRNTSGNSSMYPYQRSPYGKSLYKPYITRVFMGYNPQESLENTINTMGTLLGVHPIVLWTQTSNHRIYKKQILFELFFEGVSFVCCVYNLRTSFT